MGDLGAFAQRWSLDEHAQKHLEGLDPSILETVIADFAPREDTVDVRGKLHSFVRSVVSRRALSSGEVPADAALIAFIQKWQLDEAAETWLLSLPADVMRVVLQEFDPKADTQNVSGKLKSFARSVQARLPHSATSWSIGSAQASGAPENLYSRLSAFVVRWGVEESLNFLKSLPETVLASVLDEFDPKGDTKNVNGRLQAFAKSRAAAWQGCSELGTFVAKWGLAESTVRFLQSMPKEMLATVISQFDPRADTQDMDGKLNTFARGIMSGTSHRGSVPAAGKGKGWATAAPGKGKNWVQHTGLGGTVALTGGKPMSSPLLWKPAVQGHSTNPSIDEFVTRWGLGAESVELLQSMSSEALATVMAEFLPRSDVRDMNGKFTCFVRSVASRLGSAQGKRPLPPLASPAAASRIVRPRF